MKRMEVGVRKVEMWEVENWSMRFRYLGITRYISSSSQSALSAYKLLATYNRPVKTFLGRARKVEDST